MAGLCFYKLCQWEKAAEQFGRHPQWKLWLQKALIMKDAAVNAVRVGDFETVAFSPQAPFTQTDTTITVAFQLGDWLRSEVRVEIGLDSVDVFLTRADRCPTVKSFELEGAVNAVESSVRFSSAGLEISLKKRIPGMWTKLFVKLEADEVCVENLIQDIHARADTFGQFDDSELMQSFEEAQLETLGMPKDRIARS
jgi:hypothetical protein